MVEHLYLLQDLDESGGVVAAGLEVEEFAAYFWDVESGMLPPELRGLGPQAMYDALDVPVPRDGGLQDLIDRAELMNITHVLAERSDRVARAMLTSLTVEHGLKKLSVEAVYANEPTGGTESGRLRVRLYGQAEGEIYRAVMLEQSTGGQIQHAVQGHNHGYPPYPYKAVIDENAPDPGRNRFGRQQPKKKLVPHDDERRFPAARALCRLRREEHLKGGEIVRILSAGPKKYPIETEWTRNRVEGLIANPKLAGHQVYNRKAARTGREGTSRWNPISEWAWSPKPVHAAVVSLEEWKLAQEVTAALRGGDHSPLLRVHAAACRRGLTVTEISTSGAHAVYQRGARTVVVPTPIPDTVAQHLIEDMEGTR
ncbi:recombinase family protein [Streptomyces aureocirculatus]|uniref:recombinase family protein n=1 Tax=Streptomyces aureocirculatus TaxID=67275 RepID=UPI000AF44146|nr:recombinase family protein [Streptomyces aureocirculatus]